MATSSGVQVNRLHIEVADIFWARGVEGMECPRSALCRARVKVNQSLEMIIGSLSIYRPISYAHSLVFGGRILTDMRQTHYRHMVTCRYVFLFS